MLAVAVVLVVAAVMVTGSVLAVRLWKHELCHRRERLDWEELVACNRELDRELTRTWQRHAGSPW